MRTVAGFALAAVAALSAATCAPGRRHAGPPLEVVPRVDLARYAGAWYEIARYPNRFQKGCFGSRATYRLLGDGRVEVVNECFEGSPSGRLRKVEGKARVVDPGTNAKLEVTFFWPFAGDYWIIDLGADYEYAVVGHPGRTYLWVLSRTKSIDEEVYRGILARAAAKGYDVSRLERTVHE